MEATPLLGTWLPAHSKLACGGQAVVFCPQWQWAFPLPGPFIVHGEPRGSGSAQGWTAMSQLPKISCRLQGQVTSVPRSSDKASTRVGKGLGTQWPPACLSPPTHLNVKLSGWYFFLPRCGLGEDVPPPLGGHLQCRG